MPSLKRAFAAFVGIVVAVWVADYVSAKMRGQAALGSVQVQPYYAVPLKDGKTEFMMLDPEQRTCVRSLAPHFGYDPCWYLDGKKQQKIGL